jgi:hypothetical protein
MYANVEFDVMNRLGDSSSHRTVLKVTTRDVIAFNTMPGTPATGLGAPCARRASAPEPDMSAFPK